MEEIKDLIPQRDDDEIEIDLGAIFQLLLQKLWLIVLCFCIGSVLVFGWTKFMITPQYSASSMIYILTKTTSVTSLADIQMGSQLTVDFEILAKSRPVIEEVIDDLGVDYTYGQLCSMISVNNPADTRILKFTATCEDPKLAKEIANAVADVTADRVAYVMATDKPKIVEEAVVPDTPSSPNTVKNAAMGGLVGAFLVIAVILIRYFMNDTVQTEDDVRKYMKLNVLATIPVEKGK